MATYFYLKACNLLFEEGILSEKPITSMSSLQNMEDGFAYFKNWKKEVAALNGGIC